MAETVAFKYRAFISYSHADTAWAKWLHKALESFRIDKDLVGRETATGTVPKSLRPIFRDRDDFTAGHALTDQTLAALDASAALVVICSPSAAKSDYVTEEIRLFKSRHPDRPAIPLIVDGTPGDPENECFPPSLKFALDDDGQITDQPVEMLAADAREQGDGKTLALAKVVAGLLGVSSDDIFRRAERERRKRQRNWIAGLATVALMLAGLVVWAEINRREAVAQREVAERNFAIAKQGANSLIFDIAQALRDQEGMRTETVRKILGTAEEVIGKLAERSPENLELLRLQGVMLNEFSMTYGAQGDTAKQEDTARKSLAIAERLTNSDPSSASWQVGLASSYDSVGDVLVAQGDLAGALKAYENSLVISKRLVEASPGNDQWQSDLSTSYSNVGEVLMWQGKLAGALKAYENSLAIDDRLARANPGNTYRQQGLAVSYERVGDVLRARGNFAAALQAYRNSLATRELLTEADPGNAGWQRDLFVSYINIGKALEAHGKLNEALRAYQDSLAIMQHLTKSDPGNAQWQRDLFASHSKIGDVFRVQGDLLSALKSYRDGLAITYRLAKADPGNASWQHDLAISYTRVGEVLRVQGDLASALEVFEASRAIAENLARSDPSNANWQRGIAISHQRIADVLKAQGDLAAALKSYQAALSVVERLASTDINNGTWQRDLFVSQYGIGIVLSQQGDVVRALDAFQTGRAIIARLKTQSPENPQLAKDLVNVDAEIAKLEQAGVAAPDSAQAKETAQ